MALRTCCASLLTVTFLASFAVGQEVFDVTKYGAVGNGKKDNSDAFLDAWKASCGYDGKATLVVPAGNFLLGPVLFEGPCPGITVSIDGTLVALSDHSDIGKPGWIEFNNLHEADIGGRGTLDGQGPQAWKLKKSCPENMNCRNLPTSLRFNKVNNATVWGLHLVNSKGFHMNFHQSANIQVHNLDVSAPEDSPNTDGIHISSTNNIQVTNSTIGTGDDCISIGPGATDVNIFNIVCGPGHGISIGSLGKYKNEKDVLGITVKNCTLTNTDNGLRLKTWPGSPPSKALNVVFEDVVVENVANPIIIDQEYCPEHQCTKQPSLVKVADVTFRNVRGTSKSPVAVTLACSESIPCEDVKLENIDLVAANGGQVNAVCSNVKATFSGVQKPDPCV